MILNRKISVAATAAAAFATIALAPATHAAPPPDPGVNATITPEGDTNLKLGGPPMRFNVTLDNEGPDVRAVGLVVSMGHCGCGLPGASMMVPGTMQRLDSQTNEWVKAPYVRQGTGMDFIMGNLVPPFPLAHGQTVSYELQVALDADPDHKFTDGKGGVEVTLANGDNPMEGDRLGKSAFLPITVQAN
jgi:hypothetical protein